MSVVIMNEEEFNKQKILVDTVLAEAEEEVIVDWVGTASGDYWYEITFGGHLRSLEEALTAKGVNTDSIKVMSYVEETLVRLEDSLDEF